jgi:hypothetical protein
MSTTDTGAAAAMYARKYHQAKAEADGLRAINTQLRTALQHTTEMLGVARLIMHDDEARRMATEAVNTAREIIEAAS